MNKFRTRALSKLGWRTLEGESIFEVIKGSHVRNFFKALRLNLQQHPRPYRHPTAISSIESDVTDNTIRIFNMNTWMSFFVGGPNRRQRMNRMLEYLHEKNNEFDVLTFQELFTFALKRRRILRQDLNYVVDALRDVGYVHDTTDLMVRNTPNVGQNAGLLIMSRVPIEHAELVTFDSRRKFSAKGVLRCELKHDWVLYNTHLEHKKTTLQKNQIETVTKLIENDKTSVLLGDFNEQLEVGIKGRTGQWVGRVKFKSTNKIIQLLRIHELTTINNLFQPRHDKEVYVYLHTAPQGDTGQGADTDEENDNDHDVCFTGRTFRKCGKTTT